MAATCRRVVAAFRQPTGHDQRIGSDLADVEASGVESPARGAGPGATESGRAVKSVDVIPKRSREGDVRPCELESEGSLIRIFSRRYVVDYDAEVRGRVERARTRWRRNRAKWRKRQT